MVSDIEYRGHTVSKTRFSQLPSLGVLGHGEWGRATEGNDTSGVVSRSQKDEPCTPSIKGLIPGIKWRKAWALWPSKSWEQAKL